MRRHTTLAVAVAALLFLSLLPLGCDEQAAQQTSQPSTAAPTPQTVAVAGAEGLTVSGPIVHDNLAVYLVHGKDTIAGEAFLTLDEALAKKVLVVHETENVNELTVDNVSERESIFIQGGEIVSGGKQDRVLGLDLVVPPKTKGVKLASFCVEQGRWSKRARQSAAYFSSNLNHANSVSMKLAIRRHADQRAVWDEVSKTQGKLQANARLAPSIDSPTSLDLTLEDPKLKVTLKQYTDRLAKAIEGRTDVVGFAFAVNGELNSADVYGSNALLCKLWPKLLKASAVEAVAERQKDKTFAAPAVDAVSTWLADAHTGKASRKTLDAGGRKLMSDLVEGEDGYLWQLRDSSAAAPIHRSYLRKPPGQPSPDAPDAPEPDRQPAPRP